MDWFDGLNTILLLTMAAVGGGLVFSVAKLLARVDQIAESTRRALAAPQVSRQGTTLGVTAGQFGGGSTQEGDDFIALSRPSGTGAWPTVSDTGVLEGPIKVQLDEDSSLLEIGIEVVCALETITYLISNKNALENGQVAPRGVGSSALESAESPRPITPVAHVPRHGSTRS